VFYGYGIEKQLSEIMEEILRKFRVADRFILHGQGRLCRDGEGAGDPSMFHRRAGQGPQGQVFAL